MTESSRRPDRCGSGAHQEPVARPGPGVRRRRFLRTVSAVSVGMAAGRGLADRVTAPETAGPGVLPQVPFGPHRISRLICGANPFNAGSHLSVFVNHEMRTWYTTERILETLRRCEEVGVNLWQGNDAHHDTHRRLREEGSRIQYISLGRSQRGPGYIRGLRDAGCIGVAHHGEVTDRLFKAGRLDEIHDFLKEIRDAGLLVGVSTHMPDVVDAVESRGWDIDFFMTCVYERHRSRADLEKLLGQAPIPVGEVYLPNDPPRMFRAIRQTGRTCLAFKILAAGRLSERKQWVEEAFRQTFESIKPTDAVIVGMWDKYSDQPGENAAYVRRFGQVRPVS